MVFDVVMHRHLPYSKFSGIAFCNSRAPAPAGRKYYDPHVWLTIKPSHKTEHFFILLQQLFQLPKKLFRVQKTVPHTQKNHPNVILFWRFRRKEHNGAVGFWFGCTVLENIWLCDTLIASHTCDSSRAQGAPSNFTGPPQTNSSAKKAEWPNLKKIKADVKTAQFRANVMGRIGWMQKAYCSILWHDDWWSNPFV